MNFILMTTYQRVCQFPDLIVQMFPDGSFVLHVWNGRACEMRIIKCDAKKAARIISNFERMGYKQK